MDFVPELKIGLWNGWILSVVFLIANYSIMFSAPKENVKEMMNEVKNLKGKDKLINFFSMIMYLGVVVCSIFMPLKLKTAWFYTGLALFVFGMGFTIPEIQLFYRKPGQITSRGLFRISRNPIYVLVDIAYIGIGIATASWVFLVLVVFYMISIHLVIVAEERICLEKYGDSYREYMEKTPRYFLFC